MVKQRCPKCKIEKSIEQFSKNNRRKSGYDCYCKKCRAIATKDYRTTSQGKKYQLQYKVSEKCKFTKRKSFLKIAYNLTPEQHKEMYIKQNGCCAICNTSVPYDEIDTDHNHTTNKVRELLCRRCNLIAGLIETNSDLIDKIIGYLAKHNGTASTP